MIRGIIIPQWYVISKKHVLWQLNQFIEPIKKLSPIFHLSVIKNAEPINVILEYNLFSLTYFKKISYLNGIIIPEPSLISKNDVSGHSFSPDFPFKMPVPGPRPGINEPDGPDRDPGDEP